jgi:5'-3' exonuclease
MNAFFPLHALIETDMGVHSLWTLLNHAAEITNPELWRGKTVAVDASIWISQFRSVTANDDRDMGHRIVEGCLQRILKLLYYDIRAIFVFDGPAPALKRAEQRRRRVAQAAAEEAKILAKARRILNAQIASGALGHVSPVSLPSASTQERPARQPSAVKEPSRPQSVDVKDSRKRERNGKKVRDPIQEHLVDRETAEPTPDATLAFSESSISRFLKRSAAEADKQARRDQFAQLASVNQLDSRSGAYFGPLSALLAAEASAQSGHRQRTQVARLDLSSLRPQRLSDDEGVSTLSLLSPEEEEPPHRAFGAVRNSAVKPPSSNVPEIIVLSQSQDAEAAAGHTRVKLEESQDVIILDSSTPSSATSESSLDDDEEYSWELSDEEVDDAESDSEDDVESFTSESSVEILTKKSSKTNTSTPRPYAKVEDDSDPEFETVIFDGTPIKAKRRLPENLFRTPPKGFQGMPEGVSATRNHERQRGLQPDAAIRELQGKNEEKSGELEGGASSLWSSSSLVMDHRQDQSIRGELVELADLLRVCGIPYITAAGEAEAQCAYLNDAGIVDAILTEDSDAFVFGARCVIRGFFSRGYAKAYRSSTLDKLGLSRPVLMGLALLLGSDYSAGIPGIGTEGALHVLTGYLPSVHDAYPTPLTPSVVLQSIGNWLEEDRDSSFDSPKGADDIPLLQYAIRLQTLPLLRKKLPPLLAQYDGGLQALLALNASVLDAFADPKVHRISNADVHWGDPEWTELRRLAGIRCFWSPFDINQRIGTIEKEKTQRATHSHVQGHGGVAPSSAHHPILLTHFFQAITTRSELNGGEGVTKVLKENSEKEGYNPTCAPKTTLQRLRRLSWMLGDG